MKNLSLFSPTVTPLIRRNNLRESTQKLNYQETYDKEREPEINDDERQMSQRVTSLIYSL